MGRPKIDGWEGHLHFVLYNRWAKMIQRCDNPRNAGYKNYGGRGISVCIEWRDFKVFERWALENGFEPKLTLDRIDVNGDYSPENCRWATETEQAQNRRTTFYVDDNGVKKCLSQYARENGVSPSTLWNRLRIGWDLERAIKTPVHRAVGIKRKEK